MTPLSRLARALAASATLTALAAASGCGDDNGVSTAPATANVRFVHTVPDGRGVDVLVDGRAIRTNLQYKETIDYTSLSSGAHTVAVRPTGSSTDAVSVPVTLGDGASYTVVARGLASASGGNFPVVADALLDDAAPQSGRVSLRAMHAAPGGVSVDLYLTAPGVSLANAQPTVRNLAYGGGSSGGYANDVLSGNYQLRVTRAGTADVLVDFPAFILTPGQARTAIIVGSPTAGQPLEVLTLVDRAASH